MVLMIIWHAHERLFLLSGLLSDMSRNRVVDLRAGWNPVTPHFVFNLDVTVNSNPFPSMSITSRHFNSGQRHYAFALPLHYHNPHVWCHFCVINFSQKDNLNGPTWHWVRTVIVFLFSNRRNRFFILYLQEEMIAVSLRDKI